LVPLSMDFRTMGLEALREALDTGPRPPATRLSPVIDDYHGTRVLDPYRWLEDAADPAVQAWTRAQNEYTAQVLGAVPGREAIAKRLEQLLTVGGVGSPSVHGGKYFYQKRDGKQNQPVVYVRDAARNERVLLDPNRWSEDGTEALDWMYPSPDGRFLAYGRSSGGDEWSTLHILDVETGQELTEQIARTRACSLAWLPDGSGFYYTRYPEPGSVPPGDENYHRHVFFHRLGEDPARDPKIFGEGIEKEHWPNLSLSPDGRHLLLSLSRGWTATDIHVLDRETNRMTTLVQGEDAQYQGLVADGKVYLQTDAGAPRSKLLKIDLAHPEKEHWQEILPEREGTLEGFDVVGGHLVAQYLENASSRVYHYDTSGSLQGEIELPTLGTVAGLATDEKTGDLFFQFSSFTTPATVFRHNLNTNQREVWARAEVPGFNPADYDVSQQWYTSKDGTRVPMFIIHKKGVDLHGDNPTLLYGYGGFNVSLTPTFSKTNLLWLEQGGVYAVANLRGGGEFGADWHEGGMLGNKQNVFDDFIGAGEYLIDQGYTTPERLGIYGGSNGGLLIGAAVTQRPDLFGAAVSAVPLLDMLRYDQFGIARLWIPEYGSAQNPEQFGFIRGYSPYQNVRDGFSYPPTLYMSAAGDSRVDPLHARKMVARMQSANGSDAPILLREESKAGHGAGKPISKIIESETDRLSFLFSQLGVTPVFH
ncbi:MAG: prolyl oligopeptidase family serine peptidase, partial [Candidatus Eremiobacterota bacterium]